MNKNFTVLFFLSLLFSINIYAQVSIEKIIGEVTYRSSQNMYVKFEDTEGISAGDTLFYEQDNKILPALTAIYISSKSCAGKIIGGNNVKVGDKLAVFILQKEKKASVENISLNRVQKVDAGINETQKNQEALHFLKKRSDFTGRFSVQSYSNLSNSRSFSDFQRWRYSFSLNADEISGTAFSFASYFILSYRADNWRSIKESIGKGLKVYDLGINFKFDESSNIWFGRHLNRRVSSVSSIDGIQFEKSFGNYFSGIIAGSRPNFSDLGFNLKLFEYGFFFGRSDTTGSGIMENTFSIFQQTNNSKTDRRFIYLQHTSNILKNTNFFASTEIDIYKREKGAAKNKLTLTSLFVTARYSPLKLISFSLSYDARKNVIYYETFKSFADSILENETRQGLRTGISLRPINRLFLRLDGGYRFRKKDPKPSKNFTGSISYSNVPIIDADPSITFSKLYSSYLKGNIWGGRISKAFFGGNLNSSLSYRVTEYSLTFGTSSLRQSSVLLDTGFRIVSKLFLNLSYESTFESKISYSRILADLSLHF